MNLSPPGTSSMPTSISDLILPYQPKLSHTLTSLKKSRLSIHNRLTSILEDSDFVCCVSQANGLPLIANERCGSWYVPPDRKSGSVYFKSTDGHQGQWKFSTRRLNLGLIDVLSAHGGAIIVDSTRRGKSMPDALSKTVPIWVAVLNRAIFPDQVEYHELFTPEDVVGRSEHEQMERLLSGFVSDFKDLGLDLIRLRERLQKPIQIAFISRKSEVLKVQQHQNYHTVISCSASRHEQGDGDSYVQGAGDDTENWAHGLTAQLFWTHTDEIMQNQSNEELIQLIRSIIIDKPSTSSLRIRQVLLDNIHTGIFIGNSSEITTGNDKFDAIIECDTVEGSLANQTHPSKPAILRLACVRGKLGSKALRDKLSLLEPFIQKLLISVDGPKILISCSTGKDLSVGTALAILCRYVDDNGNLSSMTRPNIGKIFIRQRLACIVECMPDVNPSRATLQSVNSYLLAF